MTNRSPCIVATMCCCLLAGATSASAGCAWVLWGNHPTFDDYWRPREVRLQPEFADRSRSQYYVRYLVVRFCHERLKSRIHVGR